MNNDTLYIVMPAYNEVDNIGKTVQEWHSVIEKINSNNNNHDSKLVIFNDGSKDDTLVKLTELQNIYVDLVPVDKPNGGHGQTVIFAYKYALDNHVDYIFQTDSDGQTSPDEFFGFWDEREKYDVQLGNRVVRGDGNDRKFVENTVCLLIKLFFGVNAPDANAPFRLMKASVLNKYINKLPSDFNIPNIMFTTYFLHFHENVIFKEITFKPRTAGTNSINIKKIIKIGCKAVQDFAKLKIELDKPCEPYSNSYNI